MKTLILANTYTYCQNNSFENNLLYLLIYYIMKHYFVFMLMAAILFPLTQAYDDTIPILIICLMITYLIHLIYKHIEN